VEHPIRQGVAGLLFRGKIQPERAAGRNRRQCVLGWLLLTHEFYPIFTVALFGNRTLHHKHSHTSGWVYAEFDSAGQLLGLELGPEHAHRVIIAEETHRIIAGGFDANGAGIVYRKRVEQSGAEFTTL
jgi:hypothetical protein